MRGSTGSEEAAGPSVDVVVCTHSPQRIRLLEAAIESLEAQTHRPSAIVLVVDHNPALTAQLRTTVPPSVRLTENTGPAGLSGARNTGVAESHAEIVAFLDDDAVAESTWLESLARCYGDERILAVGGSVVPLWEGGRKPRWLPEEFLWVVGCTYRGMPGRGPVRNVIGCNMSFRTSVFHGVGAFDPYVGRVGTQASGCEETELCIRALKHWPDRQILFAPEAVVYHHVPKARQTLGYYLRRCYSEGVSKARVRQLVGSASLGVEGGYVARTLAPAVLRNLARPIVNGDALGSLGQAGAICLGLFATGAGFLAATARDTLATSPTRRTHG